MRSKYTGINLDSDEEDEIHPNIDEKSYRNWRRQQKEQKRQELESRLNEILSMDNLDDELIEEKEEIERILKPSYVFVESESFRTPSQTEESDYIPELEYLINNHDLDSFIRLMNERRIDMEEFENLILHNLAEQIKEGNDAGGFILSKLSFYVKSALAQGKEYLLRLNTQLSNKEKMRLFESTCMKDFEDAKKSFLEHFEADQSVDE